MNDQQHIPLSWCRYRNWGDTLNPILVNHLSGRKPIYVKIGEKPNGQVYMAIGTILAGARENYIVWGTGFGAPYHRFKGKPPKICAVRGPKTREVLLKLKIPCPKIYGDPALLYPFFYEPVIKKKYKLGIIPHESDRNSPLLKHFKNNPNINIIDIMVKKFMPREIAINKVINEICSCELIASSSLHGLIMADAYNIPSSLIKLSTNIDSFKFLDYFSSVRRKDKGAFVIKKNTKLKDIYSLFNEYSIRINLIKLLKACPFLRKDLDF